MENEAEEAANGLGDIKLDVSQLVREETYTDRKVGTIRILVPVTVDGDEDTSRSRVYSAHTQIMSGMGPVPLQAEIEATGLADAIEKFPACVNKAMEEMIEEAQQRQREEANKIVLPNDPGAGGFTL